MQVADDHHLGRTLERDDAARPARSGSDQLGRSADGGQDSVEGQAWRRSIRSEFLGLTYQFASSAVSQCSYRVSSRACQLGVAILIADGLDRIAPGRRLTEQVFELVQLRSSSSPISRSMSTALR